MAALSKKSRIAIVAASAPPYGAGGVASAHYNLWRALRQRGYAARLFTFYDNGVKDDSEPEIVRHGVAPQWLKRLFVLLQFPWRVLQPGKLAYQAAEILRNAPGALRMARSIREYAPDTVLLSDHGAPGLWLRKSAQQCFVLTSHHNPARIAKESGLGAFSALDTRLAIWLENQVLKKVDQVLCPSGYMREWFKQTYAFDGPVSVVPNMIDLSTVDRVEPQAVREQLGLPTTARVVYMPSAGSRIKGAEYLLEIIDALLGLVKDPLGFYIPGYIEPEVMDKLEAHKARGHMLLPGQVSYAEHIGYVKASDVAISPALMENFSMAIVEAACLGLPVVAFRRGGNADIIEDGKNGYLVADFNAGRMADRAAELLNAPNLETIQQETKAYTRGKFSADRVLDMYLHALVTEAAHG
ncbi:MAG: glycosyltransferase family 4 protein [Anaerolineales bacterium]|nr:glycosyltransferase family 4 protein [Anaerolineales bacterium]